MASAADATAASLLANAEPGLQADQAQFQNYQTQLNAIGDQTAQTQDYSTAMANIQGSQMGIGAQQLGLQMQGNQLQTQLAGTQQGIEEQQYGLQQGQFGEQAAQAARGFQTNQNALSGQMATSGVVGSAGQKQQAGNQLQGYKEQQGDIYRAQLQSQLGQKSEEAGYQEQYGPGGQNSLTQKNLSLMAQANGLSYEQLVDQLNYGLAQTKQQGIASAGQLAGQMGNLAAGDISTAGAALAPIAYAGNVNPVAAATQGQ